MLLFHELRVCRHLLSTPTARTKLLTSWVPSWRTAAVRRQVRARERDAARVVTTLRDAMRTRARWRTRRLAAVAMRTRKWVLAASSGPATGWVRAMRVPVAHRPSTYSHSHLPTLAYSMLCIAVVACLPAHRSLMHTPASQLGWLGFREFDIFNLFLLVPLDFWSKKTHLIIFCWVFLLNTNNFNFSLQVFLTKSVYITWFFNSSSSIIDLILILVESSTYGNLEK